MANTASYTHNMRGDCAFAVSLRQISHGVYAANKRFFVLVSGGTLIASDKPSGSLLGIQPVNLLDYALEPVRISRKAAAGRARLRRLCHKL